MGHYYLENLSEEFIYFSAEESKHLVKVMRYEVGDIVTFTDGKGNLARARLTDNNKTACCAQIIELQREVGRRNRTFHLAISPTKNAERMEWLVEKAVEIGIETISFVICSHSERKQIDISRMNRIAIAALKQSSATFLPKIQIVTFKEILLQNANSDADKFIAWCESDAATPQFADIQLHAKEIILLVGPEGDFSETEISEAKKNGFYEVKLGNKILRTETAGLYATTLIAALFQK